QITPNHRGNDEFRVAGGGDDPLFRPADGDGGEVAIDGDATVAAWQQTTHRVGEVLSISCQDRCAGAAVRTSRIDVDGIAGKVIGIRPHAIEHVVGEKAGLGVVGGTSVVA